MISLLEGNDLGVPHNENYVLYQSVNKGKVVFAITQQGKAINCHMAMDKDSLRELKASINEFCNFIFCKYNWCKMMTAIVSKDKTSIVNVLSKCGFLYGFETNEEIVYLRLRNG